LVVDIRDPHPFLPNRRSEGWWKSVGADKCKALAEIDRWEGKDWYLGSLPSDLHGADGEPQTSIEVPLIKWQQCGTFHSSGRWYNGPNF
jgi:hypothetical protein